MAIKKAESNRTYYLKDVGEILLRKSSRAQKMNIRVKPFDGVIVTVPARTPYNAAIEFAKEKQDWIKKSLEKTGEFEGRLTVFTPESTFATRKHQLLIEGWEKDLLSVRVINQKILVKYPKDANIREEQIQTFIRRGIERALRVEAAEYFPARLSFLAKQKGFKYRSLTISNAKSRWGSCSRDNNISLNLHLMRLPSRLIDYVILHELCHTEQKNHSRNFWKLMEKVLPDAKVLNKELSNFNTKVY